MACSLDMRYFLWNLMIYFSLLIIRQFLESPSGVNRPAKRGGYRTFLEQREGGVYCQFLYQIIPMKITKGGVIAPQPPSFYQFTLVESPLWCASQSQHLISVLMHLSLLCPLLLHLAHVAAVSRHLFSECPFLRQFSQLIGLSKYSYTLVFACSPGISMNLGGSFSLKSVGVERK